MHQQQRYRQGSSGIRSSPFSCGAEALRPDLLAILACGDQEFGRMFDK